MTALAIIALASALGRPVATVEMVAKSFPLDPLLAIAVVERESQFHTRALRVNPNGLTDWGLWQLAEAWHPQYRESLKKHVAYGAGFLFSLIWLYRASGEDAVMFSLSHYHSGKPISVHGLEYAQEVMAIYQRLKTPAVDRIN